MKVDVKFSFKAIIPAATLGILLVFVPASLGESGKPAPTPICEAEVNLLTSLRSVKTPQNLRQKVLEAQMLLTEKSEQLKLSRIARSAQKASPKDVPALKSRLTVLLEEKCVDKD